LTVLKKLLPIKNRKYLIPAGLWKTISFVNIPKYVEAYVSLGEFSIKVLGGSNLRLQEK
jgi:hypothetical protein